MTPVHIHINAYAYIGIQRTYSYYTQTISSFYKYALGMNVTAGMYIVTQCCTTALN